MDVALLTVGDELLAGDTVNSNAAWLAREVSDRGGCVRRILTVPDDHGVVAEYVREWSAAFDALVVTGGLGGTPDDVTMAAVADGLDREYAVNDDVRERLRERAAAWRDENPDRADGYEFDTDLDEAASLPAGGRPVWTDAGWMPGYVVENVYVLPGVPGEMKAAFAVVAEEFAGDAVAETLFTPVPEGALVGALDGVRDEFDVSVGSYPGTDDTPGRVKVTGTDSGEVAAAAAWLRERVETVEPPDGG